MTSLWWLVSGLLSTAVNLLALAVIGYVAYWLTNQPDDSDGGGGGGGKGKGGGGGAGDISLEEARRIMEKYK